MHLCNGPRSRCVGRFLLFLPLVFLLVRDFGLFSGPYNFVNRLGAHFEQPGYLGNRMAVCNQRLDLLCSLLRDSTPGWIRSKRATTIFTDIALRTTSVAPKADTLLRCTSGTCSVRLSRCVRKIVHYMHITKLSCDVTTKLIDQHSRMLFIAPQSLKIDINRQFTADKVERTSTPTGNSSTQ